MGVSYAISDQTATGITRFSVLARDIKVSHTIFAMPFALLATFLAAASAHRLPDPPTIGLIVACMILARTLAMAVNRWADADLDSKNPRTANRAIPAGRIASEFVLAAAVGTGVGLVAATGGFWWLNANPYPLLLSPLVIAWLAGYSFTKRFTWLCHIYLGGALAISPLAAGIAIQPSWLGHADVYLLAAAVLCWVAGFDIIYALQDVSVDRQMGIKSLPANLGVSTALTVARSLHVVAMGLLVTLGVVSPSLGAMYLAGCTIVAALMTLEHTLIWRSGTKHLHMAFFTLNGAISVVLGGLGIFDAVRTVASTPG